MGTKRKLAIFLLGAGASGKSTTTKAFVKGEPNQIRGLHTVSTMRGMRPMKTIWTVYDNCALAGSHNSGSDANNGPNVIRAAWEECMKLKDIVIVDGMMVSPQWAIMTEDWHEANKDFYLGLLLVHFDLTPEQVLERLAKRRGVDKEDIREKMMEKCTGNCGRPISGLRFFEEKTTSATTILTVTYEDSTEEIIKLIQAEVDEFFTENW